MSKDAKGISPELFAELNPGWPLGFKVFEVGPFHFVAPNETVAWGLFLSMTYLTLMLASGNEMRKIPPPLIHEETPMLVIGLRDVGNGIVPEYLNFTSGC